MLLICVYLLQLYLEWFELGLGLGLILIYVFWWLFYISCSVEACLGLLTVKEVVGVVKSVTCCHRPFIVYHVLPMCLLKTLSGIMDLPSNMIGDLLQCIRRNSIRFSY